MFQIHREMNGEGGVGMFKDREEALAWVLPRTARIEKRIPRGEYLESASRGAVAGALEHAQVGLPWTDGLPVLAGHDPGQLVEMS